jgi:hypothetical protein
MGATVVAVTTSAQKIQQLKSFGVDEVIVWDPKKGTFDKQVLGFYIEFLIYTTVDRACGCSIR